MEPQVKRTDPLPELTPPNLSVRTVPSDFSIGAAFMIYGRLVQVGSIPMPDLSGLQYKWADDIHLAVMSIAEIVHVINHEGVVDKD